ncbi:serine 3-dehydrogenase [Microdochium bolleyi]|uniref:Serine 3-dehydrogenase n=1 Tax=Microdochium bolleyi TaxID=196109 RepID=A0A136J2K5_9PEZI|nr:serine 3-dehydrogenase [Microdochium bolleyi]
MSSTSNNLWFIVGATSGFGLEIANQAIARGDQVGATSRKATSSDKLQALESKGALLLDLDATSPDEFLRDAITKTTQHFGRNITYFINAVGYILEGAAEEISAEEGLRSITTNVLAVMNLSRIEAEHLRTTRPSSSGQSVPHHGGIANFGSLGSWKGGPAFSHYAAAKWAVTGFTESLHHELAPFGIHAIVVEPGYFRTGFLNAGGGNRLFAEKQLIEAYKGTPVEFTKQALSKVDNNQPGDVVKGCKVIVDVLTGTGAAEGRKRTIRLVLGKDCVDAIREKMAETEQYLQEWEDLITTTDHDDVHV